MKSMDTNCNMNEDLDQLISKMNEKSMQLSLIYNLQTKLVRNKSFNETLLEECIQINNKTNTFLKSTAQMLSLNKISFAKSHCIQMNGNQWTQSTENTVRAKPSTFGFKYLRTDKYKCEDCLYSTPFSGNLSRHMIEIHSSDKPIKCSYCSYATTRSSRLNTHLDNVHYDEHNVQKPFACDWRQCHKAFISSSNLNKHRLSHTLPFVCDVCQKGFKLESTLRQHRLVHSRHKPYKCQYCSHRTVWKRELLNHMKAIHSDLLSPQILDKLFECEFCKKRFTSPSKLKRHENSHIGLKPYECDQCLYKTVHKQHLIRHKLNNSHKKRKSLYTEYRMYMKKTILQNNEVSLSCVWPECHYLSGHQNAIKSHIINNHIGKAVMRCQWNGCQYKCKDSRVFSQHIKTHKGLQCKQFTKS